MAGAEGPGCALAVDAHQPAPAAHLVLFELGEIVGHVVYERHEVVAGRRAEGGGERLPGGVGEHVTVRPCEVGRSRHRPQVALPLRRVDRDTGELPVRHLDAVRSHGALHRVQLVGAGLVAEAPAAAVDHHAHHALGEAERLRRRRIFDTLDHLHLEKVVAGPERAELPRPPRQGLLTHRLRPRARRRSPLFAAVQVARRPVAAVESRRRPSGQHILDESGARHRPGAEPSRDPPIQLRHHLAAAGGELPLRVRRAEQADAAADVEPDPARRHHAAVGDVGRGDTADREAVPPVDVRHRHRRGLDAGEVGDVGDLRDGPVLLCLGEEPLRREHDARDPHAALRSQFPADLAGALDSHAATVRRDEGPREGALVGLEQDSVSAAGCRGSP